MKTYTEKIHTERTMKMMEKKDPCICCPAAPYFDSTKSARTLWDNSFAHSVCDICRDFVGLDIQLGDCPCIELGEEEALKQTWLALKDKGYLK